MGRGGGVLRPDSQCYGGPYAGANAQRPIDASSA
jgi:hypothetical protein